MEKRLEKGQALILVALAFVGLAAFIGLAVDAGILFTQVGHLRRAVDAAALAAANQFREGLTLGQLENSAKEFLDVNGLDSATASIFVCEEPLRSPPYTAYHDPALCTPEPRKLVRVEASMPVDFAFLPVIGFGSININAEAVSETASVDLILVIDSSGSMSFDLCADGTDNDGDGVDDDCKINDPPDEVPPVSENDVVECNTRGDCEPFESVRSAAQFLVNRMYFPYDRLAIVTFSQSQNIQQALDDGDGLDGPAYWSLSSGNLNALQVDPEPDPLIACPDFFTIGDPAGCGSTNTAAGIRAANNQLGIHGREEAVWIVILLSDGAANAAMDDAGLWICPGSSSTLPTWIEPYCRDADPATRHPSSDPSSYDAEDRARDQADLLGCLPPPNSAATCPAGGGNGAVIFTIGLGNLVTNNESCEESYYGSSTCDDAKLQGEKLLRYIAGVGDDGDPATPAGDDPCNGVADGADCGNYYFSPTGSGVMRVFQAIAGRIFTRLNH